ncbi:GAD-like domain-containing protein [Tsukamurella strandjordii]|uniref:GAD-like domain-containing protein n=1 Tax=Tsukamurella TaxID=2060 RepID=UPI001C7D54F1|nr:GAD-like domain-containing protein [Tsukamurella sp. TY48]GIZ95772.1 hypothetical protein TTY48_03840 [Tsukamurella sp. TY48]
MTDEYFRLFLKDLPLTTPGPACTQEHLDTYRGVLPDPLLSYWQEYGFSGFGDGIVWLVDPLEWRDTTTVITAGIEHAALGADVTYIPIVRNAFGDTWFWTPGFGKSLVLHPTSATAITSVHRGEDDLSLQAFFATSNQQTYDATSVNYPGGLFAATLDQCGPLEFNQVYHFTPSTFRSTDVVDIDTATIADIHTWLANMKAAVGDWPTAFV